MGVALQIRRYGAWLVDQTKTVRWSCTKLVALVGSLIVLATFLVLLALPQIDYAPDADSDDKLFSTPLLIFALVAGFASFATGVIGNIAADRCMKWRERRAPTIAEFFGNHQLTRLVGQSLAMLVR